MILITDQKRNLQNILAMHSWLFPSQNLTPLGKSLEGRILEQRYAGTELIIYVDIVQIVQFYHL